ncbi:MAG: hypothetical protein FD167_401 [bacterium]|nr:MAG: hypothetical protein FD167_401 [bacterium]
MSTPETPKFIAPEKDEPLLSGFSQTNLKVLGAIILLLVVTLGYKFFSKPNVKLIAPTNNQVLGADELDFQWQSNKSNVSYVIEVHDGETSDLVMRQMTDQVGYKPDRYQQSFFQADHKYYWLVMSNPDIKQSHNFRTESMYFTINKTVEPPPPPVAIPTNQQNPIEQQSPTPEPSSSPASQRTSPDQQMNF